MIDKFQLCDDQTFTNTTSTGEISSNYLDLEQYAVADQQVVAWLNVRIISATVTSGLTEGLLLCLIASDATAGSSPEYLGVLWLKPTEVAAGNNFCIGVSKQLALRYLSLWAKAVTTALVGNFHLEAFLSDSPILNSPTSRMQKKPA